MYSTRPVTACCVARCWNGNRAPRSLCPSRRDLEKSSFIPHLPHPHHRSDLGVMEPAQHPRIVADELATILDDAVPDLVVVPDFLSSKRREEVPQTSDEPLLLLAFSELVRPAELEEYIIVCVMASQGGRQIVKKSPRPKKRGREEQGVFFAFSSKEYARQQCVC